MTGSDDARSGGTTKDLQTRPNWAYRLSGIGLAVVWVAASLWQQLSWTYAAPTAITCGQARFPIFGIFTVVTTVIFIVVSGLFYLNISVRPGNPDPPGSWIVRIGLGISALLGLAPLGLNFILLASTQGLGEPPATVGSIIDEVFVLAMFLVPPLVGIASLSVAQSGSVLARLGRVNRARRPFAIAGGFTALGFVAMYAAVAVNCGNYVWIVH